MRNPFRPNVLELVTQMGMAVLIDRLGGSVVVSQADRDGLAVRYGGAVGVAVEEVEPNRAYRFTIVKTVGTPPPETPVSSVSGCEPPSIVHRSARPCARGLT